MSAQRVQMDGQPRDFVNIAGEGEGPRWIRDAGRYEDAARMIVPPLPPAPPSRGDLWFFGGVGFVIGAALVSFLSVALDPAQATWARLWSILLSLALLWILPAAHDRLAEWRHRRAS